MTAYDRVNIFSLHGRSLPRSMSFVKFCTSQLYDCVSEHIGTAQRLTRALTLNLRRFICGLVCHSNVARYLQSPGSSMPRRQPSSMSSIATTAAHLCGVQKTVGRGCPISPSPPPPMRRSNATSAKSEYLLARQPRKPQRKYSHPLLWQWHVSKQSSHAFLAVPQKPKTRPIPTKKPRYSPPLHPTHVLPLRLPTMLSQSS